MDLKKYVEGLALKVKKAQAQLASLKTGDKNEILAQIAKLINKNRDFIVKENEKDMKAGKEKELSSALLDRLLLNEKRMNGMIESLESVIALPDPVGEVFDQMKNSNGLIIGKQRMPLGVIGMIYESRPNVTVEASSITIKSGNGIMLRGGSEAFHSNLALAEIIHEGIRKAGFNENMVGVFETTDREAVNHMLKADHLIDVIIPRGGEGLIKFVCDNSTVPVIKHDKGTCTLFVNHDAPLEMAKKIAVNAKVQRPGVCNAIENIIFHKDYQHVKEVLDALKAENVEIRCYGKIADLYKDGKKIDDMNEFNIEYLDLIISTKFVDSVEEAVSLINEYGSGHSDSIISKDYFDIQKFTNEVRSAAVYANASTRFTDGFAFGLGAEIGISTNMLHARGPVGLKELTTYKYVVFGEGQIR